jgi:hypothetical protein
MVFSICLAPASIASSALPLVDNISHAAAFTSMPESQVEITIGVLAKWIPLAMLFFETSRGVESTEICKNFLLSILLAISILRFFKI